MYPNSYDPTAVFGGLLAGGVVFLLVYVLVVMLGLYIGYRIMRTAVRDGVTDALKRSGYVDPSGSRAPAPAAAPVAVYGGSTYSGATRS